MTYRIFISYATGDENSVKEIYETLSRLEDIEVYVPEHGQNVENASQKIKESLDRSNMVVVLITFNSTNTMWLNQEIGYASGKDIPIISIVEKGIDVEG
ncbi:MAG: toll/interleukin-1 receptor domain-containing protein, partial [Patescibacteria group bacterium]|nr:toll/interleukin-1 receptor domain-containing protein [Patescibacteria group bacterium]